MKQKNKLLPKIQKILIFFIILGIAVFITFFNETEASDELWNFQNILKMNNGFALYKDANVIVTPLFFYVGLCLFKILGATLLTFRIYDLLIYFFIFYMVYRILRNLKISSHIAFLCVILTFLEILSIVTAGANYNALAISFVLIGVNLYIKRNNNTFLHGLIIFLVFFTKQNIGIFYILGVIICDLYLNKFSKAFFISIIKKLLVFIILSSIIILKLYFNNTLLYFINYAFGGLFEFQENNFSFSASIQYIIVFLTPFIIYIAILLNKNTNLRDILDTNKFENITILMIFTFFISFIIYPIANSAHFLFAISLHLIFLFYVLDVLMLEDFFANDEFVTKTNWISILILLIILLRVIVHYFEVIPDHSFIQDTSSPFYGFMISDEYIEKTNTLKDYILNKNSEGIDVIIVSYDAGFPMIELKQSHGVYDLLFNGNLGYNGKENIKNDILNRKNTEFLVVTNEDDIFLQEPPEIREFIMQNLSFEGTIENYSIYMNY
jgi:hypothetical protein